MQSSKWVIVVLASVALGGIAGALTGAFASSPRSAAATASPQLERSVTELTSELESLKQRLASLEQRPAAAQRVDTTKDDGSQVGHPAADPAAERKRDADAALLAATQELAPKFEELIRNGAPADELDKLLNDVRKKRQQDAAIGALQALIEKNPTDAKAHYLLGKAYYARIMLESTIEGYQKWGELTLKEWERSSEIDPHYWEPRFDRAEYLTYYPESQGKTPEAIAQFEALIAEQHGSTANPKFARSYAHLGRMYLRAGRKDKAETTFRAGADLFPDDKELKQQVDLLKGN